MGPERDEPGMQGGGPAEAAPSDEAPTEQKSPGDPGDAPEIHDLSAPGAPHIAPPPSWSTQTEPLAAPASPDDAAPAGPDDAAPPSPDALRSAPPPTGPAHPGPPPPGALAEHLFDHESRAERRRRTLSAYYSRRQRTRAGRIATVSFLAFGVVVGILLALVKGHVDRVSRAQAEPSVPLQVTTKRTTVGHAVELRARVGTSGGGSLPKAVEVRLDVLGVHDPATPPAGTSLPSGLSLATVSVQACATKATVVTLLAFAGFNVSISGGQQLFLSTHIQLPGETRLLDLEDLPPGRCVSGVLPFEVPTSTPVKSVDYETLSHSIHWRVPS